MIFSWQARCPLNMVLLVNKSPGLLSDVSTKLLSSLDLHLSKVFCFFGCLVVLLDAVEGSVVLGEES